MNAGTALLHRTGTTTRKREETAAAQWLDAAYDDRTMEALFPNMTFTAE